MLKINSTGSAMIMALVTVAVLSALALYSQQQALQTQINLRRVRIKNLINHRENLLRNLLRQTSSYTCTGNGTLIDLSKCQLNVSAISNQVQMNIPGCESDGSSSICGIVVDPKIGFNYDANLQIVKVQLIYNGTEMAVAPISDEINIRLDFLSSSGRVISCTPDKPFLMRINLLGQAECRAINPNHLACHSGEYLKSLTADFSPTCEAIRTQPLSCGSGKYIQKYVWVGGNNYDLTCANIIDPFSVGGP